MKTGLTVWPIHSDLPLHCKKKVIMPAAHYLRWELFSDWQTKTTEVWFFIHRLLRIPLEDGAVRVHKIFANCHLCCKHMNENTVLLCDLFIMIYLCKRGRRVLKNLPFATFSQTHEWKPGLTAWPIYTDLSLHCKKKVFISAAHYLRWELFSDPQTMTRQRSDLSSTKSTCRLLLTHLKMFVNGAGGVHKVFTNCHLCCKHVNENTVILCDLFIMTYFYIVRKKWSYLLHTICDGNFFQTDKRRQQRSDFPSTKRVDCEDHSKAATLHMCTFRRYTP